MGKWEREESPKGILLQKLYRVVQAEEVRKQSKVNCPRKPPLERHDEEEAHNYDGYLP